MRGERDGRGEGGGDHWVISSRFLSRHAHVANAPRLWVSCRGGFKDVDDRRRKALKINDGRDSKGEGSTLQVKFYEPLSQCELQYFRTSASGNPCYISSRSLSIHVPAGRLVVEGWLGTTPKPPLRPLPHLSLFAVLAVFGNSAGCPNRPASTTSERSPWSSHMR